MTTPGSSSWVYIVTNPAFPGRCKIGKTKDLYGRLAQMNTHDPKRGYSYHTTIQEEDAAGFERRAHKLLAGFKCDSGEWFYIHAEDAAELLQELNAIQTHQEG